MLEKTDPNEAVGVVCSVGGAPKVVEYSGKTAKVLSTLRDKDNPDKLAFRAANIANHFFTLDFLKIVWSVFCTTLSRNYEDVNTNFMTDDEKGTFSVGSLKRD